MKTEDYFDRVVHLVTALGLELIARVQLDSELDGLKQGCVRDEFGKSNLGSTRGRITNLYFVVPDQPILFKLSCLEFVFEGKDASESTCQWNIGGCCLRNDQHGFLRVVGGGNLPWYVSYNSLSLGRSGQVRCETIGYTINEAEKELKVEILVDYLSHILEVIRPSNLRGTFESCAMDVFTFVRHQLFLSDEAEVLFWKRFGGKRVFDRLCPGNIYAGIPD